MASLLGRVKCLLFNFAIAYVIYLAFWKCPEDSSASPYCPRLISTRAAVESHELYIKHVEPLVEAATPFIQKQVELGVIAYNYVLEQYDTHLSEKVDELVAYASHLFHNTVVPQAAKATEAAQEVAQDHLEKAQEAVQEVFDL
ncbi:hypothetical protein BABINDRAFT_161027 [Babjeviella inositovora NRRL Y-12698]|uniref:Uncharacterized protein n=1 Tax=Babjeviella inositovora NRRL Y-12698 TaxID=984486 RepID=A0A1E3QTG0_9ASCO|nr:uncharacterized protein BABINDRAFT_161027 [Babjeviella inositovora NRRL Y-12698]ODQ80824.1 hypothetical protein BABINDRAFT_161027 [Babjeviella inositovora NRRL Y-12698]